jgi:hypothetical protein
MQTYSLNNKKCKTNQPHKFRTTPVRLMASITFEALLQAAKQRMADELLELM